MSSDPFAGFDLETRILDRAGRCGLVLEARAVSELAAHARAVLRENPRLKLTTIENPADFLERHLGEAFEGASKIAPGTEGLLLDVGSGNGYPGLPIAAARPLLEPLLAEAQVRKARFLREVLNEVFRRGAVVEGQIQRAGDLGPLTPLRIVVSRAAGGWERIIPRLVPALAPEGEILLWAGEAVEEALRRESWKRLHLAWRRPLPGRDTSWVWCFRTKSDERNATK